MGFLRSLHIESLGDTEVQTLFSYVVVSAHLHLSLAARLQLRLGTPQSRNTQHKC